MVKSFLFWYAEWSAIYIKVSPAVDSVGVNSEGKFGILIFFTILIFLVSWSLK